MPDRHTPEPRPAVPNATCPACGRAAVDSDLRREHGVHTATYVCGPDGHLWITRWAAT